MISTNSIPNQFRDLFAGYVENQGGLAMVRKGASTGMTFGLNEGESSSTVIARYRRTDNSQIVPQYEFQNRLRPMFGKGKSHPPSIGDHPDFAHLKGTNLEEFCAVTTLFMDMEGSTRLNLLYPPSDVARIKNAFIQMAIEVVKAFDGHVHRIMGDAVMAYFGGTGVRPESSGIDAINCASVLQALVRESVIPYLEDEGFGNEFGIRIGVDYGPEDRVLWRSYGFPGMEEVTATSFHVDVASKLQHAAGRHEVVIGGSLRELLDFPEQLLAIKTVVRNGVNEPRPYLRPNLTDENGRPINYPQHVLVWDKYLECSPLGGLKRLSPTADILKVTATIHSTRHGEREGLFVPGGTLGGKSKSVCFNIAKLPFLPQLPYVVKCIVENHGEEARLSGKDFGNHEKVYEVLTQGQHQDIDHWEDLAYRGLHYLTVEIRKKGGDLIARRKFGVYVE